MVFLTRSHEETTDFCPIKQNCFAPGQFLDIPEHIYNLLLDYQKRHITTLWINFTKVIFWRQTHPQVLLGHVSKHRYNSQRKLSKTRITNNHSSPTPDLRKDGVRRTSGLVNIWRCEESGALGEGTETPHPFLIQIVVYKTCGYFLSLIAYTHSWSIAGLYA